MTAMRPRRADRTEVRQYREAVEACFALVVAGGSPEACERALRHLSVTELGMPLAQQQEVLAATVAAYVESNDLCPLCGGPPHEEP